MTPSDIVPVTQADREYRKTRTIKARQWFKMGDHPAVTQAGTAFATPLQQFVISTLEGPHFVQPGDWIATGVKGEHWPIKPDIFEATYEPAAHTPQPAAEVEELVEALTKCRDQFRFYEEQHLAKGTHDGDAKAATNYEFKAMCDAALTRATAADARGK